jgi:hypothetical protein
VTGDADAVAYPVDPLADALTSHQVKILPGVDHIDLPKSSDFQSAALAFLKQGVIG